MNSKSTFTWPNTIHSKPSSVYQRISVQKISILKPQFSPFQPAGHCYYSRYIEWQNNINITHLENQFNTSSDTYLKSYILPTDFFLYESLAALCILMYYTRRYQDLLNYSFYISYYYNRCFLHSTLSFSLHLVGKL